MTRLFIRSDFIEIKSKLCLSLVVKLQQKSSDLVWNIVLDACLRSSCNLAVLSCMLAARKGSRISMVSNIYEVLTKLEESVMKVECLALLFRSFNLQQGLSYRDLSLGSTAFIRFCEWMILLKWSHFDAIFGQRLVGILIAEWRPDFAGIIKSWLDSGCSTQSLCANSSLASAIVRLISNIPASLLCVVVQVLAHLKCNPSDLETVGKYVNQQLKSDFDARVFCALALLIKNSGEAISEEFKLYLSHSFSSSIYKADLAVPSVAISIHDILPILGLPSSVLLDLRPVLLQNLLSPAANLRRASLGFYLLCPDTLVDKNILTKCIEVDSKDIDLLNYRSVIILLGNLEMTISKAITEIGAEICLRFMIGFCSSVLTLLYPNVFRIMQLLGKGHPQRFDKVLREYLTSMNESCTISDSREIIRNLPASSKLDDDTVAQLPEWRSRFESRIPAC